MVKVLLFYLRKEKKVEEKERGGRVRYGSSSYIWSNQVGSMIFNLFARMALSIVI